MSGFGQMALPVHSVMQDLTDERSDTGRMALPADCTVWVLAEGWFEMVENTRALFFAGSCADGTTPEQDQAWVVPTSPNRTVRPPEPSRHRARAVPSAPQWTERAFELARHGARVVPFALNRTVDLTEPAMHGAQ